MIGNAELQLIQATLRVDEDRDAAIRTAAQQLLDWKQVQRLAKYHGVLPLVYKRLQEVAPDLVPSDPMQEMTTWQKAHEFRVFQMTVDLVKVVRALEAENIPVLCLKGPTLATLAYGDPALRCYGDLDILVKQCDYPRAEAVLYALGAISFLQNDKIFSMEQERHSSFQYHHSHVEVHWRVTTREFPRALNISDCFASSRSIAVNGQPISTLSAADVAMHACHHGTQHCWAKFRYVGDLAIALRAIDVQKWDMLLYAAREQGLYRPMLVGMCLCHELLGVVLPDEIMRAVHRDPLARLAIRLVRSHLGRASEAGVDVFDRLAFKLVTAEKERCYSIVALLTSMFTPTISDFQWINLPKKLRWLYPVLRPIRRIGRGVAVFRTRNRRCFDLSSGVGK